MGFFSDAWNFLVEIYSYIPKEGKEWIGDKVWGIIKGALGIDKVKKVA